MTKSEVVEVGEWYEVVLLGALMCPEAMQK